MSEFFFFYFIKFIHNLLIILILKLWPFKLKFKQRAFSIKKLGEDFEPREVFESFDNIRNDNFRFRISKSFLHIYNNNCFSAHKLLRILFISPAIIFQSYFSLTILKAPLTTRERSSGLLAYSRTLSAILFGSFTLQNRPVSPFLRKS